MGGGEGRTLLVGAVAAVLGGAVWAMIVIFTHYEVGWVAWGVGALVGFAMARVTEARSRPLAIGASGLAVVGLLVGKWLIFEVDGPRQLAAEIQKAPRGVEQAAWILMAEAGEAPPELLAEVEATPEDETLAAETEHAIYAFVEQRVGPLDDAARDSIAGAFATLVMARVPLAEKVKASFSPWDALWFLLAVITAARFMDARKTPEPEAAPHEPPVEGEET